MSLISELTHHNFTQPQNVNTPDHNSPRSSCRSPHSAEDNHRHHRQIILEAYHLDPLGHNWRQIERSYGIPPSTYYRWVRKGEGMTRGGFRFKKVTQEIQNYMIYCIETNPLLTLNQLITKIEGKFDVKLSKTTLTRHLDLQLYSLKNVRKENENCNTQTNKQKGRSM